MLLSVEFLIPAHHRKCAAVTIYVRKYCSSAVSTSVMIKVADLVKQVR